MSERASGGRAGSVTEVTFSLRKSDSPFVDLSERRDCRFELAKMVSRGGDRYAEYFNVVDADPDALVDDLADRQGVEVSLLRRYEDGGLFEFRVSKDYPAVELARRGALPREIRSEGGVGRIHAEIPSEYDAASVVDSFLEQVPEAELTAKREASSLSPLFTCSTLDQLIDARLTDRQRDVLRTAYEAGYYEWPRECTGEEVAAELNITSATFSEHIKAAERNLMTAFLDSEGFDDDS